MRTLLIRYRCRVSEVLLSCLTALMACGFAGSKITSNASDPQLCTSVLTAVANSIIGLNCSKLMPSASDMISASSRAGVPLARLRRAGFDVMVAAQA